MEYNFFRILNFTFLSPSQDTRIVTKRSINSLRQLGLAYTVDPRSTSAIDHVAGHGNTEKRSTLTTSYVSYHTMAAIQKHNYGVFTADLLRKETAGKTVEFLAARSLLPLFSSLPAFSSPSSDEHEEESSIERLAVCPPGRK